MSLRALSLPDKPVIIAHRGASGYAPENTLAAFQEGWKRGATWAELDLQLSRDDQLVVIHDKNLLRTTGIAGMVSDFDYEELRALDAGIWFGETFRGERIPSLEEVMLCAAPSFCLNIELKVTVRAGILADAVIELIRKKGFNQRCVLTSFDEDLIHYCQQKAPDIGCGLITDVWPENQKHDKLAVWCVEHTTLTWDRVKSAHNKNLSVFAWTVNDFTRLQQLTSWGVDGLITNFPDYIQKK